MCRGFTLTQPEPRRPAAYGSGGVLDDDPLVAGGDEVGRRTAAARPGSSVRSAAPATRAARSREGVQRTWAGSSSRSAPSRWSTSKKNGVSGTSSRSRPTSALLAVRAPVTWNGCGRPSSTSAMRLAVEHEVSTGSAASASVISGIRSVTSSRRAREEAHRAGARAVVDVGLQPYAVQLGLDDDLTSQRGEGRGDVGRGAGEHRAQRAGRPRGSARRAPRPRRSGPRVRPGRAKPATMTARRTAASGTSAALATAWSITPSPAP